MTARLSLAGWILAVHRQHRDGNFQHNGIDVVAADGVGSIVVGIVSIDRRRQNRTDSPAEIQRVKRSPQVDEEWVIRGSGPYADSVAQAVEFPG